jgi:cysteinyl-tRNA synthetase
LAYPVDGDVYFAVDKFPDYGKLSKRKLDDMMAGARIDVDERKRHPMDFALWKAGKPGEPEWDSPWGRGRPGWHIECSAMASKYLGQPFDIHGGGNDLVFPHHENEIAQSEGALDQPLARYWLHNGMVNIGQEKMSKSLGNFMTVQQAADLVGGEALRLFVLSTQYRAPLAFSEEQLLEKKTSLNRLYESMARAADELDGRRLELDSAATESVLEEFRTGMDDDFNSPRGLATIFDSVRALNRHLDAEEWSAAASARAAIATMGGVLGLVQQDPHAVLERAKRDALEDTTLSPAEIERLIGERAAARKGKDFKRADAIRQELLDKGIVLEDKPDGTIWRAER